MSKKRQLQDRDDIVMFLNAMKRPRSPPVDLNQLYVQFSQSCRHCQSSFQTTRLDREFCSIGCVDAHDWRGTTQDLL